VGDTEGKEWAIDSMRTAVLAVNDKKIGFLKDIVTCTLVYDRY
jgi:hypothetical protein